MRRIILALAATLAWPLPGSAAEGTRPSDLVAAASPVPVDPPLRVTINPEGRVTVTLGGPLPAPAPRGTPVEFAVGIINQGFATARLEARLVGSPPADAILEFHPEPLKGVPAETRALRITLKHPGLTDLTIAFRLRDQVPDLGGRDRVHLLLRSQ